MTPVEIQVALWYYARVEDYYEPYTPAISKAHVALMDAGMLVFKPQPCLSRVYFKTDKLDAYVEGLMAVPLPIQIWRVPK